MVKTWLKLKLVKNIQVILSFANFYEKFIKRFSKIATLFTLMLETTLRSRTIIVKKSDKACDNEVDSSGRAIYKKKK